MPNSLSHHSYFTSRAMGAAVLGPGKPRLSQLRGSWLGGCGVLHCLHEGSQEWMENENSPCFLSYCKKKLSLVTMVVIWNFVLQIVWAPRVQTILLWVYNLTGEGNQGGRWGVGGSGRGAVLNTTEQEGQKRGGGVGCGVKGEGRTRALIYLFAPLLFQAV